MYLINFLGLIYDVSKWNDYQLNLRNDISADPMNLLDDDYLFSVEEKKKDFLFFVLSIINK